MASLRPPAEKGYAKDMADTDLLTTVLVGVAALLFGLAMALRGTDALHAAARTARPFLEVGAVVVTGWAALRAGLFDRLARPPAGWSSTARIASLIGATALLAGFVNLDVAVVVMMPIALIAAGEAGVD